MNDRKLSSDRETPEQGRERVIREGQEAQRILENTLVKRFFSDCTWAAVNDFAALPFEASEPELRAVHGRLKHLHQFKAYFEQYISKAQDELVKDKEIEKDLAI